MPLEAGLSAALDHVVTEADLAPALASGDVPVLATPRVVAWFEAATVAAIDGELEPGSTTVGMRVHIDHVAPTAVGSTVCANAVVARVEGRRITFDVSAIDRTADHTEIASGQIVRVIVDRERFLARLASS